MTAEENTHIKELKKYHLQLQQVCIVCVCVCMCDQVRKRGRGHSGERWGGVGERDRGGPVLISGLGRGGGSFLGPNNIIRHAQILRHILWTE